ncbi:hypothetical protein M3592_26320 [Priestia aryabhattai]|uniref:hypothetical protein n=1 Tax=Priestia aryabhattai TaxID=412384 RepID=UPI00203F45A2|nr:hypothetical protein [Priestia aryabhattai]MCM2978959.1 hypothetical protein [Priestia aryabhattai]MDT0150289.1 hypothetical protein [Priestia aryabhattai]MDT0155892.1 hypothetical protein [Priestia aryabhattai]
MDEKTIGKITRNFAIAGWIFVFLFIIGYIFPFFFILGFLGWGIGGILFFFNFLCLIWLVICVCKNVKDKFYIRHLILTVSFVIVYPIFFYIVLKNAHSLLN